MRTTEEQGVRKTFIIIILGSGKLCSHHLTVLMLQSHPEIAVCELFHMGMCETIGGRPKTSSVDYLSNKTN